MIESNKVLFIINKFSGGGFQDSLEGRIIDACGKAQLECSIEFTQTKGHAIELAKQAAQQNNFKTVFAVGGDGTVNEVAQGLVGTSTLMGIIPNGSGNGLARHLRLHMNFKKSLTLIESTRSILMDTLLVNNMLSVNVSGVGFDGHVAGMFGKDGTRGFVGYSKLVLKEFFRFKEFVVEVEVDGEKINRESFIIALANSSQYGNNARVAPQASVCDQLIDVCFIKKIPVLQSIEFGYKMFSGGLHRSALVEMIKAKKISLRFNKPIAFHIDGEAHAPIDLLEIKIQPASLRMLVAKNDKA